jgi:hypothetical protein
MYMIFNLDPDGDCYSLHAKLEDAQYVFRQKEEAFREAVNM